MLHSSKKQCNKTLFEDTKLNCISPDNPNTQEIKEYTHDVNIFISDLLCMDDINPHEDLIPNQKRKGMLFYIELKKNNGRFKTTSIIQYFISPFKNKKSVKIS